jgi:hypothetical protein
MNFQFAPVAAPEYRWTTPEWKPTASMMSFFSWATPFCLFFLPPAFSSSPAAPSSVEEPPLLHQTAEEAMPSPSPRGTSKMRVDDVEETVV